MCWNGDLGLLRATAGDGCSEVGTKRIGNTWSRRCTFGETSGKTGCLGVRGLGWVSRVRDDTERLDLLAVFVFENWQILPWLIQIIVVAALSQKNQTGFGLLVHSKQVIVNIMYICTPVYVVCTSSHVYVHMVRSTKWFVANFHSASRGEEHTAIIV